MEKEKEPFEKVYDSNFSTIYNYVYSQVLHRERAEDLVSDVFFKAMNHYDRFDPSIASAKTWLMNIARNTIIDSYRKSGRRQMVSLDDEDNYEEPSYEDEYSVFQEETEREVYQLLKKLTDQERELVSLIYFQDMKNEEAGRVLGCNAKAVSERHRRLLGKCRKLMRQ